MRKAIRCFRMLLVSGCIAVQAGAQTPALPPPDSPYLDRERDSGLMGSAYVPLDSWVYAAFDRLAALGYVSSSFANMRPWTRIECARLLYEMDESMEDQTLPPEIAEVRQALLREFARDSRLLAGFSNVGFSLDSIYTRFVGISGRPLTDGFHFGQTITNDFGRPYAEGGNVVSGFSARAMAGPMVLYMRGEYQHAPSAAALPDTVTDTLSALDFMDVRSGHSTIDRFRFVDAYVAFNLKNMQISAGKQSLWWGPSRSSSMTFSNNAESMYMVRISRVSPIKLPGPLGWLGPLRSDFFLGRMVGHRSPARPWVHGQKLSFKPTPNLELGFSKTATFAGAGRGFTLGNFWRSFSIMGDSREDIANGLDRGDRRGGMDFTYRIPGLRDWLIFYCDAISEDDPLPVLSPGRAGLNPGFHLPRIPGLPKMQFRAEGVYTPSPPRHPPGAFTYWNFRYHDGYTNNGNIIGSWIGREGTGYQLWSTYSFSAQSNVELSFRNAHVSVHFIPGGVSQAQWSGTTDLPLGNDLRVSGVLSYERWKAPLLDSRTQANFSMAVELEYKPKWGSR